MKSMTSREWSLHTFSSASLKDFRLKRRLISLGSTLFEHAGEYSVRSI